MFTIFLQAAYTLCCLMVIIAIWSLQQNRHREAEACVWYAYHLLAISMAWEILEVWMYGPPDIPASRWLLIPTMAFTFSVAAHKDAVAAKDAQACKP
jgi:hypothetical protein